MQQEDGMREAHRSMEHNEQTRRESRLRTTENRADELMENRQFVTEWANRGCYRGEGEKDKQR